MRCLTEKTFLTQLRHPWRNRILKLEFHGIPVTNKKNLLSKINEMAKKLSLPELMKYDITSFHRIPSISGDFNARRFQYEYVTRMYYET